jgi:uncharacterized UPF0160 family protein
MQKTLVTHNGKFHADDVFAVATFLLVNNQNNDWQVVRSRDEEVIKKADAVIDVGGEYNISTLRFDHHQVGGAGDRGGIVPFASFGLVWNIFGEVLCGDKRIADEVDRKLVTPVDANDVGVSLDTPLYDDLLPYTISNIIEDNNITWKEESEAPDGGDQLRYIQFMKMVEFASDLIKRQIIRTRDKFGARKLVENAYHSSMDKRVVIMDSYYPWQDVIMGYAEPLFVVYPDARHEKWSITTVPKRKGDFESRALLPESWAGLRDESLASVTGVSDAIFCHNARFLAVAKSKEGVLELARLALE